MTHFHQDDVFCVQTGLKLYSIFSATPGLLFKFSWQRLRHLSKKLIISPGYRRLSPALKTAELSNFSFQTPLDLCCFCCHHRSILSHYFAPFYFFHKEKQPNIFLVRLSSIFEIEGGTRYKPEVTVTIHFFFFFKKRSCLLSTCNLIYFHSILPEYFLFCFVLFLFLQMIISFPAWTDGDGRRRPWRAVTKRSVIAVRLLDRRYQLQGKTARQKRRVRVEPPTRHYYTCQLRLLSEKARIL